MEQLEVNNSINHAVVTLKKSNYLLVLLGLLFDFGGNRTGRLILNMFFGCTTGRDAQHGLGGSRRRPGRGSAGFFSRTLSIYTLWTLCF